MDEELRKQALEWFERGNHDIETAQLLYDEHGYTEIIAYHIQQAIEKYLKGYLVLKRIPLISFDQTFLS
jgi:HEPN domain-containing protein